MCSTILMVCLALSTEEATIDSTCSKCFMAFSILIIIFLSFFTLFENICIIPFKKPSNDSDWVEYIAVKKVLISIIS